MSLPVLALALAGVAASGGGAVEGAGGADDDGAVVVVTYNILAGQRGLDGIAATLERAAADIIALQEVDRGARRSGRRDQAAAIARKLGMQARFVAHFPYQGGEYGLALPSRHRIVSAQRRAVKGSQLALLDAVVDVAGVGAVRVIVCHFTVTVPFKDERYNRATERARVAEAQAVAALVKSERKRPVIVLGDMNDDTGSPMYTTLQAAALQDACELRGYGLAKTWSSAFPITRIDYAWASPHFAVDECSTLRTEASDHLPVRAVLSLIQERAAAPRPSGRRR